MDNFSDIFTLEGAGFREVGNYRYQVKCLHVTEAYRPDISTKQKFIFYSLGRYSETKRDIGMGHKKSNDGYAWGTKRLLGENWLRVSFDCVLVARSRVSNSAFNIPYPPLAYIFWTAWTWAQLLPLVASKIYHNYKKVEQIVIEWSVFWGVFLVIVGVRSRIYIVKSAIWYFSVHFVFLVWNHIVSHRYW